MIKKEKEVFSVFNFGIDADGLDWPGIQKIGRNIDDIRRLPLSVESLEKPLRANAAPAS